jgi:23S rRNA (cytidine2498-2'-O)-methyltransferase
MKEQFLFFCVNIGNEKLLKEEIQNFYPEFTLSYSRKGFITYKNKGILYTKDSISQLECTFATRSGICLGKTNPDDLNAFITEKTNELKLDLDEIIIHSFSINTDYKLETKNLLNNEVNQYSSNNKNVIDIIAIGENEIWMGLHLVTQNTTRYPNANIEIKVPTDVPSIAYLKLAQAIELYSIKIDKKDLWLDFGCVPGGSTTYLLSKGIRVWGIDTAVMKDEVLANKNYTHIQSSVQDLSQEKLPNEDIKWVHVDLNLNPNQAIKEILRLIKKYNHSLKGIIFTVQLVKSEYIKNIEEFEDQFYDWGFIDIISRQVPTHKNEFIIIAKRKY